MSKVRINDLARELEVKSKAILDVLPQVGVTEKKTHSSSIEVDEAVRVRAHFQKQSGGGESKRPVRDGDDLKPKFDFSHISKPGDIRAILERAKNPQQAPPAPPKSPTPPPVTAKPPAAPPPAARTTPPPPPAARTE